MSGELAVADDACRTEWTGTDGLQHVCRMPADRPHDWHVCPCGVTTEAAL